MKVFNTVARHDQPEQSVLRNPQRKRTLRLPEHLLIGAILLLCGLGTAFLAPQRVSAQTVTTPTATPTPTEPDLARQLVAIEPLLPSLYLGTSLLPQLPELTGVHGPRTYLLVVQNSDELRATGGFISALGVITLEQGRLANLEFVDSYRLYHEDQS
ncbi:MAG: DUF4012 domain-containing protein, partial [Caldilineaceae bacterium]|nr:DUF4012 domain-containing protein [Caldilineaceae bacterium]